MEFKLPDLGEGIDEAEVVRVLVAEGDAVEKDQPLLEVEAEKASLEVPSDVAGKVSKILVKEGDQVKIGQAILSVEATGDGERPPARPAEEARAEAKPGKAEAEAEEKPKEEEAQAARDEAPEEKPAAGREPVAAAPSVRQFAREIGVDIAEVSGSGPGGRITLDDVKAHARRRAGAARPEEPREDGARGRPVEAEPASRPERLPLPDFAKWGNVYSEPVGSVRRTIARQMVRSWSTIPHVTLFDEADVTAVEALREQYTGRAEAAGGKLTITVILLKVAAVALNVFPRLNASLDADGEKIIYKQYSHLGVATDTERGLVVPVIRDVDKKSMLQLAVELAQLAERARHGSLSREETQGASFTVTSLGGIGTAFFTPIINPPEVAILGLGRIRPQPNPQPGSTPQLMLPLSLSIDHRVVDGADGARFLQWIIDAVSQPLMLALEG